MKQIKRILTICLMLSTIPGNILSGIYAYAANSADNQNIKFHLSPYVDNKPTNNEDQTTNGDEKREEEPDQTAGAAATVNDTAPETVNADEDTAANEVINPAPAESVHSHNALSIQETPPSGSEGELLHQNGSEAASTQASGIGQEEATGKPGTPLPGAAVKPNSPMLQGGVVYTVPSGTPIKLKLASVPSHPMKIMDHDLEGKLYPAHVGQEITARTSEDIYVDKNKIIPEGTIFYGKVSEITPPRRVGRPGSLALAFYELTTPDGRRFAFKVDANNRKPSTFKTKAKGFGIISYYAFGGAVVGALVAYEIFGLQNTIALHGYNIAAGAAAGALLATGYAIMRKGPRATLEPGDDLNMTIDQDLLMPVAITVPEKKTISENLGLTMHVEKSKVVNDGLDEHFITVDLTATNDGDKDLSSIDLFLQDTNKDLHPVSTSPDENSQFLFHLEPHSTQHLHISFHTPYPKLKQKLVWLDHETKIVLASEKLQ